jgi:hypothetical protein
MSQSKRKGTAKWQREEKGPHVRWPSLGRKPATARPWRRRGLFHLSREAQSEDDDSSTLDKVWEDIIYP